MFTLAFLMRRSLKNQKAVAHAARAPQLFGFLYLIATYLRRSGMILV
jgi:hypothetical protein